MLEIFFLIVLILIKEMYGYYLFMYDMSKLMIHLMLTQIRFRFEKVKVHNFCLKQTFM